ncbi:MAG: tRNA uridine-5-carboxymethylaminomethyl(34) synthesis GTPase MnmE [Rhodospirillales bacterium]
MTAPETAAAPKTIYALSSAPGRAGLAVVRVSGPRAGDVVCALTRRAPPAPGRLVLRALYMAREDARYAPAREDARHMPAQRLEEGHFDTETNEIDLIDRGCVLWRPGPASFTGEDTAEFHVHGGRAVTVAVLAAVGAVAGTAPAEPGAFTRRAFEGGRLDLTQAEGLADLIDAETEAQRRQGLRQMEGALGRLAEGWRARILRALAEAAADIDFSEDEDVPAALALRARAEAGELAREITAFLDDGRRGERLRGGLRAAVIGPPNVGKSSLLNRIAGREAAIAAPTPGTTRDVIEVHLDIGGFPVTFADTAGLRESADAVEQEGVRRAEAWAAGADIRLHVIDAQEFSGAAPNGLEKMGPADFCVVNKIDLLEGPLAGPPPAGVLAVSAKTGEGISGVLEAVKTHWDTLYNVPEAAVMTRERHRQALSAAAEALGRAAQTPADAAELTAEDLRLAADALGRITGRVDVEDILDAVFRDFCIGK